MPYRLHPDALNLHVGPESPHLHVRTVVQPASGQHALSSAYRAV